MKTSFEKFGVALATSLALGLLPRVGVAAFNSGSTGADGAFNPTADTERQLPPSGVFNFTSVNIPSGVTVTFRKNTTNTPVTILASGDFVLAGTIDVSGTSSALTTNTEENAGQPGTSGPGGYAGGRGGLVSASTMRRGGDGLGPGGGKGGGNSPLSSGGGGAGSSSIGGNGFNTGSGAGGVTYGSNFLLPLIGGSGGGGGGGGSSLGASGGGGGSGGILIAVSGSVDIQPTGRILANGGGSGSVVGDGGGCGGGGSGGAIRLVSTVVKGSGLLQATGGISSTTCGSGGRGGAGSLGRIRVEAEKLPYGNTSNSPPPSMELVTGPVFIPSQPVLRIASVAGAAAPAAPTGNMDVDLPATTSSPVTVELASTGIPLGTVVALTAKPYVGAAVTVTSAPLAGSVDNATASASISLPVGHSVLTAMVSYTITAALGDAFGTQYANGERVEKIEISAAMRGPSKLTLVTVSGKRIPVPGPLPLIPVAG